MLLEIKERIIDIAENISLSNGKQITGLNFLVDNVGTNTLPVVLPLVRPFSYGRTDARGFTASIEMDLYLYIRAIGDVNIAQAQTEPHAILDLFAEAFLTRPQLQFNSNTLNGIIGNLDFALVQGLDEPITYPPKSRQGAQYWGAVFRLTIQKRLIYPINVSGV